jgi:hypothetical protein
MDAGGASGSAGEGGMPEGGSTTGGTSTTGGASTGGTAGASTGGTAGADNGGAGGFGGDDSVVGGAGGEGGEAAVQITIVNPDFEGTWADPPLGWTEVGTADASGLEWKDIGQGAHSGHYYLNFYKAADYEVTTSQTILSVPNGNYSLAIWHQGGAYTDQYVFARGYDSGDTVTKMNTAVSDPWEQIVISPIPVSNGQIQIGVYSKGVSGSWSHFDDVTLTKLP